jgi:hypothetical protein
VRAHWLAVASVALAWAIAGELAWAFPVEIYRAESDDWLWCGVGCPAIAAIVLLIVSFEQWHEKSTQWVLILLLSACAGMCVYAFTWRATHIVVAVSPRELRVDLRPYGRPVQVGRERINAAQVRCVVRPDTVCETDGSGCDESFDVTLMLGRRSLAPSTTHSTIGMARGQCAQLAAYGIRMEERR